MYLCVPYKSHTRILALHKRYKPSRYHKTFRNCSLACKRLLFYPIAPDALSATSYLLHALGPTSHSQPAKRSHCITTKHPLKCRCGEWLLCGSCHPSFWYPPKRTLTAGHAHCRHAYIHHWRRSLLPSTTSNSAAAKQSVKQQQKRRVNSPLF